MNGYNSTAIMDGKASLCLRIFPIPGDNNMCNSEMHHIIDLRCAFFLKCMFFSSESSLNDE